MANTAGIKKLKEYLSADEYFRDAATSPDFESRLEDAASREKLFLEMREKELTDMTLPEFDTGLGFSATPSAQSGALTFKSYNELPANVNPENVQYDAPPSLAEQEKGFWHTWFGDAVQRLNAGSSRLVGNAADLTNKFLLLPEYAYNGIRAGKWEAPSKDSTLLGKASQYFIRDAETSRELSNRYGNVTDEESGQVRQKNFKDLWKEGDYTGAIGEIFLTATESAPVSVLAATTGGAGLGLIGATAANEKYNQLAEENPEMSEVNRLSNAVSSGAIEGLSERLGGIFDKNLLKTLYRGAGKDAAQSILKSTVLNTLKESGVEGAEEVASTVGENITDYVTGKVKDFNPFAGVPESFVYGAAGGMQFAGPVGVASYAGRKNYEKRLNAAIDEAVNPVFDYSNLQPEDKFTVKKGFENAAERLNQALSGSGFKFDGEAILNSSTAEQQKQALWDIANAENLSNEQKSAIFNYVQKGNARLGMQNDFENRLQQSQQQAMQLVEQNLNPQMNAVVSAIVSGKQRKITGGNIMLLEDGSIDMEQSDSQVYYPDDEGKIQVAPISQVEKLLESVPAEEALRQAGEIAAAPVIAQQENEEARPYEAGEKVRLDNGLTGEITGQNEDGTYRFAFATPAGIQDMNIEPRQILDNLTGIDNGSIVDYRDASGNIVSGEVQNTSIFGSSRKFVIGEDGDEIPVADVIGLHKEESEFSGMTGEQLQQSMEDIDVSLNSGVLNERQIQEFIAQKEKIQKELELRVKAGNATKTSENTGGNEGILPDSKNSLSNPAAEIIVRAPKQKNGEVDYDALLEQNPEDFAALYESEEGAEETRSELASISENLSKKIQAGQKKLENATSINQKKEARKAIAEFEGQKKRIDGLIESRYTAPAEETQPASGANMPDTEQSQEAVQETEEPIQSEVNPEELIRQMEENAEVMPVLELTPENWYAEFGENGVVETPVGDVKMGENQYLKLQAKDRGAQFGMVKPTLTNPDLIIEQQSEREGAERNSVYLFVRTFNVNGEKIRHFESVTVSRDKKEVVVSNHIIKAKQLLDKLKAGHVVYKSTALDASGQTSAEYTPQTESGVPSNDEGKNNTETPEFQENDVKNENTDNSNDNAQVEEISETDRETQLKNEINTNQDMVDVLTQKIKAENDPARKEELIKEALAYGGKDLKLFQELQDIEDKKNGVITRDEIERKKAESDKFIEIFNEYKDDISLKNSPEYRKRVNDFLDGADRETIIRTVLHNREQHLDGTPHRAFTEEFVAPYALKNGLVKKKGKKYIRYEKVSPQEQPVEERLASAGGDILSFAENETKRNEIAEAEKQTDTHPTEAQKEAGNYRKGHVSVQGFDISIEQPKGSVRSGVDENGKAWKSKMNNTYGYIRGTEGRDHDHIDVFIGENPASGKVFVVDQMNPEMGEFDEHKVMLGFDSIEQAREAYLSNYEEGWQGLGNITETGIEDFRKWAEMDGRRIKPFTEYKSVQENAARFQSEQSEDLEAVNKRFNEELNNFKEGKLKSSEVLHLGKPLEILQASGLKSGEMTVTQRTLTDHLKAHNLTTEDLKGLAMTIQSPILVYNWGERFPSTVIVSELTTQDEKKISVAVRLENKGNDITVNEIATVHGKTDSKLLKDWKKSTPEWLAENIKWAEKEKVLDWLGMAPPKGATLTDPALVSIANVIQNFENPKLPAEKLQSSDKKLQSIPAKAWKKLIERLQKTGLARNVIADETRMREYLEKNFGKDGADRFMAWYHGSVNDFDKFERINAFTRSYDGIYFSNNKNIPKDYGEILYEVELPELSDEQKPFSEKDRKSIESHLDFSSKMRANYSDINFDANVGEVISQLENKLGSAEAAHNWLMRAGVDGYTRESEADGRIAIMFNDKAIGIKNKTAIRLMSTPKGEVYGFTTPEGDVYLDPKRMNANTPVHEFGHLFWSSAMPAEMKAKITGLLKQTPGWKRLSDNPAYAHLKTDDQKADELFNTLLGNYGEHSRQVQEITGGNISLFSRIQNAINEFLQWLKANVFGNTDAKLNEFARKTLGELLSGEEISASRGQENANRLQFIGEQGVAALDKAEEATTRLDNLAVAREMETAKKEAKAIKLATGWERGADGKWRYEIADSRTTQAFKDLNTGESMSLGRALVDEELFKAYPELKDVKVEITDTRTEAGSWNPSTQTIELSAYTPAYKDGKLQADEIFNIEAIDEGFRYVLLHEIQHAIQNIEGFAKGSSQGRFTDPTTLSLAYRDFDANVKNLSGDKYENIGHVLHDERFSGYRDVFAKDVSMGQSLLDGMRNMYEDTDKDVFMANYEDFVESGKKGTAYRQYFRTAGEVEARNASRRMDMTPEERRASLAAETEDVAREDRIFLYDGLGNSSESNNFAENNNVNIDNNKRKRIEKLKASASIEITGNEITPSDDLKQYKANALEYGKSLRDFYANKDTGEKVYVGKSGIKEVLQHDYKNIEQLQSVAAIPQIIKNAIYIDSESNNDVEKNPKIKEYQYFVSGLRIGKEDYTVRSVIAVQDNGERYYDHKLSRIEKGKLIDSLSAITNHGFNQSASISDIKDTKLLSILQTNNKGNKENLSESSVRFQIINEAEASGFKLTDQQVDDLEKELNSFWKHKLWEGHLNNILPVKKWIDMLRASGMKISDSNDYYKRFSAISGIKEELKKTFKSSYFSPLTEAVSGIMKKTGYSYTDINSYLFLKHIPERNEQQAKRAVEEYKKKNPDYTEKEIEGVLKRLPDNGLAKVVDRIRGEEESKKNPFERKDAEAFARKWVQDFEEKAGKEHIDQLWKKTGAATKWSLEQRYAAGLISRERYEEILSMFKYYVPLKGHDETTAEEIFDYGREPGTFFTPQNKRAEGRSSIADDPLAYIFSNAQSEISESVNNEHLQTIYRVARKVEKLTKDKGEKPMVTVGNTWFQKVGEKDGKTVWKVAEEPEYPNDPNLSPKESQEEYRKNIEMHDRQMEALAAKGEAFKSGKNKHLDIGMFIKPSQARQHDVHVWNNGVMYSVRFHTTPAIARAINGANRVYADRHRAGVNQTIKTIGKGTRFLSMMYTTAKPAFMLFTNPVRDAHTLLANLYVKEGAAYAGKAVKNYAVAWATIGGNLLGRKMQADRKYTNYFYEYTINGGKTGQYKLLELRKIQKEVESELKQLQKEGVRKLPASAGKFLASVFENVNMWSENTARFATYITSREMKRSVIQSVSDAKNVTVNFDRKGSGAYWNAELRALYAFTNVGLQSVYNTYNIAKENKVRFGISIAAQTAAFLYLFPYINSLLARLRGDDDDEEWISELAKKSEYERNSNISFYTGKEGGFLKLPLSQEYRMFNGLAMDLLMWKNGKADAWTTAKNFTIGLLELIAYNPVLDAHRGSIADAAPTVFVGAGQLITNSNFTSSPIFNSYADDALPMYRQVRTNRKGEPYTPEPTIKALQWMNKQTGGDETMPGWISKLKLGNLDLSNPDVVNHLMSYYLGAFYNPIVKQIENFGSEESNGKKIKNLLAPGAMYRSNDDSPNLDRYTENKYYELKKKSENADSQFKDYAKNIKEQGMDAFLVKMNKNPEVWRYAVIKTGVDAVKNLEKEIKKQAGNAPLQKEQQMKADELKLKLVAFDKRMKGYGNPALYSEEDLKEALDGIVDDLSEFLKE